MNQNHHEFQIFSDGACKGNPGPGGWGVVIISKKSRIELKGYENSTTNNRMELKAVIEGLKSITNVGRYLNIIKYLISLGYKVVLQGGDDQPYFKGRNDRKQDHH